MPDIEIADVVPRVQYVATAGQTVFDFPFVVTRVTDMKVHRTRAGITSLLGEGAHYEITGLGEEGGGSITLTAPSVGDDVLTLWRDIPIARAFDFTTGGDFRATTVNSEEDEQILIAQQLERDLKRTFRFPNYIEGSIDPLEWQATTRANKVFGFDAFGNPALFDLSDVLSVPDGVLNYPIQVGELGVTNTFWPPGDVRRYGAVGDGIVDDTDAVQAAIDYMAETRGTVKVPSGIFLVTALQWLEGVSIEGDGWNFDGSAVTGSVIKGTTGEDIFTLPDGGFFRSFSMRNVALSGGQNHIVVPFDGMASGDSGITFARFDRVMFWSPEDNGWKISRHIEEWYSKDCEWRFGEYGVLVEVTVGNFDKNTFENCLWTGQTFNAVKTLATFQSTNTFINAILNNVAQHGFYLDGGIDTLVFVNLNTEGTGTSGKKNRTTGSITAASDQLTVASAAGWTVGDIATVMAAGGQGTDLYSEVDAIVGNVLTLHDNAVNTVTDNPVTNAVWDDVFFAYSVGAAQNVIFIGGVLGGEALLGRLRYAINASGLQTCRLFGTALHGEAYVDGIPVYDPNYRVGGMAGYPMSVRQRNADAFTPIVSWFADTSPLTEDRRTLIVPPAGRHVEIYLIDSERDTTGDFGSFKVRRNDINGTQMFQVDGETQAVRLGVFGHEIKGVFEFRPTLNPVVVAANTTEEHVFFIPNLPFPSTVSVNPPPISASNQAGTAVVGGRVTAFEELTLTIINTTAGALNAAGGTYQIFCAEIDPP